MGFQHMLEHFRELRPEAPQISATDKRIRDAASRRAALRHRIRLKRILWTSAPSDLMPPSREFDRAARGELEIS